MLDSFLSFLKKYENRKVHNMIPLMLDPRFKSSYYILCWWMGCKSPSNLVEFLKKDVDIEEKLEELEGEFERDEVIEV